MNILHTKEPIKNCPCCGGAAEAYQSDRRAAAQDFDDSVGIQCIACFLKIEQTFYAGAQIKERLETVLMLWNRRVGE